MSLARTISIERVANGWLVRPFAPGAPEWYRAVEQIWVFHSVDEIQEALPRLLEEGLTIEPEPIAAEPPSCRP